jgi:hypothetical protein
MATLAMQFKAALGQIEPKEDAENAGKVHQQVSEVLEADDWLTKRGISTFLIGSYGRDVSIRRVKAVDVFARLKKATSSLRPGEILDHVTEVLEEAFPGNVVRQHREAARCLGCQVRSTSGKDWVLTRPHDLPSGGGPVAVQWRKRRWRCCTEVCPRGSFTEQVAQVPAGMRTTTRLRTALAVAVEDGRDQSEVAASHGVSWPTVQRAVVARGAVELAEPEPIRVLGMDETRFSRPRWLPDGHHDDGRARWKRTVYRRVRHRTRRAERRLRTHPPEQAGRRGARPAAGPRRRTHDAPASRSGPGGASRSHPRRLDLALGVCATHPRRALDALARFEVLVDLEEVLDLHPVELRQVVDVA